MTEAERKEKIRVARALVYSVLQDVRPPIDQAHLPPKPLEQALASARVALLAADELMPVPKEENETH